MADADPEDLIESIRSGGLANTKTHRIQTILKEVKAQQGQISLQFLKKKTDQQVIDYLTSLNGVGLKTAACVLLFGMARDICPVDTADHNSLVVISVHWRSSVPPPLQVSMWDPETTRAPTGSGTCSRPG